MGPKLLYKNALSSAADTKTWVGEGPVKAITGSDGFSTELSSAGGSDDHFTFWCPEVFPDRIRITWEFAPVTEPGLAMLFFGAAAAASVSGDASSSSSIFGEHIKPRNGAYPQYHSSDIATLHVSYFRRRWADERAFHTCNLRKSPGFHLVAQGADPLPSVADVPEGAYYKIEVIKDGPRVTFAVDGLPLFSWTDDDESQEKTGPVVGGGRIGFNPIRRTAQKPQRRFQSTGPGPNNANNAPKKSDDSAAAIAPGAPSTPSNAPTANLAIWQRLGPLTKAANAFTRANQKRPWVTQVCSSLFIYLIADLNAQRIGGKEYDPVRTRNMLITGACFSIPGYEWFKALGGWFTFSSKALSVATRVLFNQFTFAPLINVYFFSMQALLTGADPVQRVVEKGPETWMNSWIVWPSVIAFNLAFVPFQFRGLVAGCVSVCWQTYLSIQNKKAELLEEANKQKVAERETVEVRALAAVA
ncbi:hypothetical protein E8E14_012660 [Neopestalotiopsis sp. 37M]|nr:hypothetical protein E8E14_012660 [Neopestalotiopsis sp. 37M]